MLMEQESVIKLLNDSLNRLEVRLESMASQSNASALQIQKLTGMVEQFNRRLEFDLKVYLDGEKARLDVTTADIASLKTDKTRVSTILWFFGFLWGILVTLIGLWFSGLGTAISHFFHKNNI